jgi:hypothetical protein
LVGRHWELARRLLARDNQIPTLPLAVFLYRDYAFLSDDPAAADVVTVFREEFGYAASLETGEEEYRYLYREDEDMVANSTWFEEL